ncbi:hypothetical protein BE17_32080 [Sorangium cellulosum]|uniref:Uncharacterized protein n=1 Tax=Sorangium cellulosum TaxID=56 RepID=A0A150S4H8_SORCE|nr:hypothetical protein BE17_32080 [Sorangium cellulosum]
MHDHPDKRHAGHHGGAEPAFHPSPALVRNRYFYSMLLEAQDMLSEQAFHLGNARRHSAEMHGHGTLCGLRVDDGGGHEAVVLRPGVAADCLGREIRVERDVRIDLHEAAAHAVRLREQRLGREEEDHPSPRRGLECAGLEPVELYLSLRYQEALERPVQAFASPDAACTPACEASRVRHGFHVEVSAHPPSTGRHKRASLVDELFQCERERLSTLLCDWITDDRWASGAAVCAGEHGCVGLARVRLVPGGQVIAIDNCAFRPLVLPTGLLAELLHYAVYQVRRGR